MKQVKVIKTRNGQEVITGISERLAANQAYMQKHGLRLVQEIKEPIKTEEPKVEATPEVVGEIQLEPQIIDIRTDAVDLAVSTLEGKYHKEEWVALGKELGLRGNVKGMKEATLINKIKEKLAE